jgi:hypothetical protein
VQPCHAARPAVRGLSVTVTANERAAAVSSTTAAAVCLSVCLSWASAKFVFLKQSVAVNISSAVYRFQLILVFEATQKKLHQIIGFLF